MLSFVLVILVPIAFASAATYTNRTADCEFINGTLNVYQHPIVSSSYSIPAVTSSGSTVTNKTWQITDNIGNLSDTSNVVDPEAEQFSHYIFLDTSSTINASSLSSPVPFAGCAFTFELPSSYIGKTSSDGSCGQFFGQSCLNETMQIAQGATATIPATAGSTELIEACKTVSEAVNSYILTSNVCSKDGPSIVVTQGLNFSYPNIDNCTDPPTTLPIPLLERVKPFQPGNYTLYDQLIKTTTPMLLSLFSNATTLSGAGDSLAEAYLTCTSPMNVTAGSHDPKSAADHSAVADVKSVVSFALAINALVFLML